MLGAALCALSLAGCALSPGEDAAVDDSSGETPTVTAEVEQRTISDVLTLDVTVVSGAPYSVSAPRAGVLAEADGAYSFVDTDGGSTAIALPDTATFVEPLVPLDAEIGRGTPILSVQDSALTLRAAVTPAQILRIADRTPSAVRAQIDGSSGPFDCALNDPRATGTDGEYALSCRVPADVPAVVGATGLLALTLDEREGVAALPIEAVAGSRTNGLVHLSPSGETADVGLGITDGAYIEITEGLAVGDTVIVPSPSILTDNG